MILIRKLKNKKKYENYTKKASLLKETVNSLLWNEQFQSYTAYDLLMEKNILIFPDEILNNQNIGLFSFQTCSNLIPLYAGIADGKRARAMIKRYVLNPKHFYSEFGIRSLSKSSEYYNNAVWGNPPRFGDHRRLTNSNWQGPVWFPLSYFMINTLINYNLISEATDLADKTVALLADSLRSRGSFTENYDAETGEPLYVSNFTSWNLLADMVHYEINNPEKRLMEPLAAS